MQPRILRRAAVSSALVLAAPASAAFIHPDRASFDAAAGEFALFESFEAMAPGILGLPAATPSGMTVDLLDASDWTADVTDSQVFSLTTDGVQHLRVGFGSGGTVVDFGLPFAATAFGLDLSGHQDQDGDGILGILLLSDGDLIEAIDFAAPDAPSPATFVGFTTAASFDSVRFVIEGTDIVGFDAVSFSAVPGPAAIGLLGLAACGPLRRRRR